MRPFDWQRMIDLFQPSWLRGLMATALAAAAFLVPQEAPLEYYPLNHPSNVYYLEITCQASVEGSTQIFYNLTRGINEQDSIRIPIAPSRQTYTYTFPLPDAPIVEMRIDPLDRPGELLITNFRIQDRRGVEIRRFTRENFLRTHEIAGVPPAANGWKLVTTPDARDPFSRIEMYSPVVPEGMNARNLQRCLLSWGYLALMLWILLLAVVLVVAWKSDTQDREPGNAPEGPKPGGRGATLARSMIFMAFIAMLFSAVGNRGLIRNSVRYANFRAPPVEPGLRVEMDLTVAGPTTAQLFWDTGRGYNEAESQRRDYEPHAMRQTLRFDLPLGQPVRALRFDPLSAEGRLDILGIRVVDRGQTTRTVVPLSSLRAVREIDGIERGDGHTMIRTTRGARDPILEFTSEATQAIAAAIAGENERARARGSGQRSGI